MRTVKFAALLVGTALFVGCDKKDTSTVVKPDGSTETKTVTVPSGSSPTSPDVKVETNKATSAVNSAVDKGTAAVNGAVDKTSQAVKDEAAKMKPTTMPDMPNMPK